MIARAGLRPLALAAALAAGLPPAACAQGAGDSSTAAAAESLRATSLARNAAPAGVSATPSEAAPAPAVPAPVYLGGRQVFVVRAARDGLDPRARAEAIGGRLAAAVADVSLPPDSVRLVAAPEGVEVRLGPRFLWLVTPGDAPTRNPAALAERLSELRQGVRDGIARERASHTPVRRALSLVIVLALTLVAGAALWLLLRSGRGLRAWIQRGARPRMPSLRLRGVEVVSRVQAARAAASLVGAAQVVAILLLGYGYLTAVFARFSSTQAWSWQLRHFAAQRALDALHSLAFALPGLLAVLVLWVVFRWLVRLSDGFFHALEHGRIEVGGLHPELARPTRRLAHIGLWILFIAFAYPYLPGSHSRAFQGVSILLGLMLSLGSTGVVGNLVAGLVLIYSRSFRVGDRVKLGEHVGDVLNLGYFATKLRSLKNEEITVPNGQVASGAIVNYTRLCAEDGLILHTEVTIGYDVDWRQVHALLVEAAGRVPGVEADPAPWVFQRGLGDNNVRYELNCVTRDSHDQLRLYSDLHAGIQDAFARAGVEILSPAYHALRDANAPVLPREPAGPRAAPGGFRVRVPQDAAGGS